MKDKQVSNFGAGLIWFGAAVSIAEILTGTLILVWVPVGIKNSSKLHLFALSGLFLSAVVLSAVAFKGGSVAIIGNMSFQ